MLNALEVPSATLVSVDTYSTQRGPRLFTLGEMAARTLHALLPTETEDPALQALTTELGENIDAWKQLQFDPDEPDQAYLAMGHAPVLLTFSHTEGRRLQDQAISRAYRAQREPALQAAAHANFLLSLASQVASVNTAR